VFRRILIVAALAVVVMLAGEVMLRLFSPQIFFLSAPGMYQPDPDVGHVLRPGFDAWTQHTEFRVRVKINGDGLRGPALRPTADDTVRILCLGDSMTFGIGVEHERAYPAVIEGVLRDRHPGLDIQVLNAGTPHYGTLDELNFLTKRGAELGPDFILLQFYAGDDFEQNRLASGQRNVFREGVLVYSDSFAAKKDPLWLRLLNSTKHESHLVHWISERVGRTLMRVGVLGRMERASSSNFSEAEARRARELLAEIHALSARLGAPMLLAFVPERMQVMAETGTPVPAAKVVREAALEVGAGFVDLTPALVAKAEGPPLYRFEVGVWTEAGHSLAAEVLAKEIEALGWIDEARLAPGVASPSAGPAAR
jgi:hypothetical protein